MSETPPEILRQVGNLMRCAKVSSVDLGARQCSVKFAGAGEELGPFPWLVGAAGDTISWSAPTVGEQVLLLCPEADIEQGLVLRGLYSTAFPAPANDLTEMIRFKDQAVLIYDAETHVLTCSLPEGGRIELTAPGGFKIDADIEHTGDLATEGGHSVTGNVAADGDVTAADISLTNHHHQGVHGPTGAAVA